MVTSPIMVYPLTLELPQSVLPDLNLATCARTFGAFHTRKKRLPDDVCNITVSDFEINHYCRVPAG